MKTPNEAKTELPTPTVSTPSGGSALALDAIAAIKKDDVIGSYDAYAEWVDSHERGYLYLKQAISALAWQLHKTGNLPMMRQAVDEVMGAERELVNEKVKAPNEKAERRG